VRQLSLVLSLTALFGVVATPNADAQGFLSPSFGYNFAGDSGCLSATDCEDRNWNFGISGGALGRIVGFEAEWVYEGEFLGTSPIEKTRVMTLMGNFMLAPRISIIQPYGLAGIGVISTSVEDVLGAEEDENQIGWNVGGGLIVYVHRNIGLKGDIRYYHSFEVIDLLDLELDRDVNELDFGRATFGVVFKF
jgi:opacity protein-like surface antigen